MDAETTIGLVIAGGVMTLWSLWGARRKRGPLKVTFVPWTGVMFLGVTALVIGIVHLMTLMKEGAL